MRMITLCVPLEYVLRIAELVRAGHYPNRAELIRLAIRDLLISEGQWKRSDDHERELQRV